MCCTCNGRYCSFEDGYQHLKQTIKKEQVTNVYHAVKNGMPVVTCMQNSVTKIGNIKAYMITALYNAPSTMNHYYQKKVQYDMYGDAWKEKEVV